MQQTDVEWKTEGKTSFDSLKVAWPMYEETEIPKISKLTVYYRGDTYKNDRYVLGLGVEYMNGEETRDQ